MKDGMARYEARWAELEASQNPVAVIVMAHLKTKATIKDPQMRKQWKWVLIRGLYERGWEREDIEQILRILDWMMTLPEELAREFREELTAYEEERKMPLITSMEQFAKEDALREVALKLLAEGVDLDIIARTTDLTLEQIEGLRDGSANGVRDPKV